jgi:hypothetical protein
MPMIRLNLVLTRSLPARIGDTLDECAVRYGGSTDNSAKDQVVFRRDHVTITVHLENDRSVREDFAPEGGGMLSDSEIAALLQENSAGSTWEKAGETSTQISYFRKDGHGSAQSAKLNEAGSGRIKLTFNGAELIVKSNGQ